MESWNSFKSRKYCEWYQEKNDVHLRWMYVRFSFVLTHKLMLVYTSSSSSSSSLISAHCPIAIGWLVNKLKRIITCEYTRKKNTLKIILFLFCCRPSLQIDFNDTKRAREKKKCENIVKNLIGLIFPITMNSSSVSIYLWFWLFMLLLFFVSCDALSSFQFDYR